MISYVKSVQHQVEIDRDFSLLRCKKMFLLVLLPALAQLAASQPTVCQEEAQCSTGFYCEAEAHVCRECLRCKDLMREPPPRALSCVKSVVDCGLCFDGLVEDVRGDVNSPCVSASKTDASERDGSMSPLVWVAVAIGTLLLVAVIAVVIYRKIDTFKVLASTRASVQAPPEPPPPYRPASPTAPAQLAHDEDHSWPFIKPSPPNSAAGTAAREHSAAQAARAFCYPAYVRPPLMPTSYEVDTDHEESDEPFTVHDEDTMESAWSPHGAAPAPPAASAAGVVATPPDAELAPPAKRLCVPQDTNNNKGSDEGPSPSIEASSSSPAFIISVVQNIHTVQQRNDVKL